MTLLNIIEVTSEFTGVIVKDYYTDNILTSYDGKDSIEEEYNNKEVAQIEAENDTLIIYIYN